MTASSTPQYELVPPDGGWGWIVVLGVFLSHMTCQSLISVFSLLFGDKLTSMGHETTSAALIMNIMSAVTNFSGLFTGPLLKKYTMRQVAIAGGVLVSTGLILTSFANSLWHMIVTYSIIAGLGLGLVTPSNFLAVKTYFRKARGRAVGLSLAGTNAGQMAMPHVVRLLLETFSFSGAVLVIGGLTMHGFIGALLFHPLEWHAERQPVPQELEPLKANGNNNNDGDKKEGEREPDKKDGLLSPKRQGPRRNASAVSLASSSTGDVIDIEIDERKRPQLTTTVEEAGEEEAQETRPEPTADAAAAIRGVHGPGPAEGPGVPERDDRHGGGVHDERELQHAAAVLPAQRRAADAGADGAVHVLHGRRRLRVAAHGAARDGQDAGQGALHLPRRRHLPRRPAVSHRHDERPGGAVRHLRSVRLLPRLRRGQHQPVRLRGLRRREGARRRRPQHGLQGHLHTHLRPSARLRPRRDGELPAVHAHPVAADPGDHVVLACRTDRPPLPPQEMIASC